MEVTVKLGDPLGRQLGVRRLRIELEENDATVGRALALLDERLPAAGIETLRASEGRQDGLPYHVFVNRRKIAWSQIDHEALRDGDEVVLFLIVVGG